MLPDNILWLHEHEHEQRFLHGSLTNVQKIFIAVCINFRKETILDFVEKLLKKGQKEDRILSSAICCALCVQLGDGESLSVFTTLKPVLINVVNDEAVFSCGKSERMLYIFLFLKVLVHFTEIHSGH